jgi:hypothetical protein
MEVCGGETCKSRRSASLRPNEAAGQAARTFSATKAVPVAPLPTSQKPQNLKSLFSKGLMRTANNLR